MERAGEGRREGGFWQPSMEEVQLQHPSEHFKIEPEVAIDRICVIYLGLGFWIARVQSGISLVLIWPNMGS